MITDHAEPLIMAQIELKKAEKAFLDRDYQEALRASKKAIEHLWVVHDLAKLK